MSLNKPSITPELEALNSSSDLRDVAKALGYGLVTTDASLLAQGGAATYESLEDTIQEIHQTSDDFKVLHKVPRDTVGNFLHSWIEFYNIGYGRGNSVSDETGAFKSATRQGRRRFLRIKFQAQGWSVLQSLIKQPNFMDEANKEDVAALVRGDQDLAWMIYEGDSSIGTDPSNHEYSGGHEFDGLNTINQSPDYYGNFSDAGGMLRYDCLVQGSGLDAKGFSNPADVETGLEYLAKLMSLPRNKNGQSPDLYLGPNARSYVNKYQNFEPVQVLDGTPQQKVKGAIVKGLANLWTDQQYTALHTDNYLPDSVTGWFLVPQLRGKVAVTPAPTLSVTPGSATDSYFGAAWAGNYVYAVAPFGKNISKDSYEGPATLTSAAAVVAGGKVDVKITAANGANESGYLIYRGSKNGDGTIQDMRLIKRIARDPSGVTTFTDLNRELPGASKAYIVEWGNSQVADLVSAFSPFRVELPRNVDAPLYIPGLVVGTNALRTRRHRSIGIISNFCVPDGTGWSAMGVNL